MRVEVEEGFSYVQLYNRWVRVRVQGQGLEGVLRVDLHGRWGWGVGSRV